MVSRLGALKNNVSVRNVVGSWEVFEVGFVESLSRGRSVGGKGASGESLGRREGRGAGMHPGQRSSFPESGGAPGTPGDETCGSRRDRLSLDFSQRRQGRAGGRSRCEATERRGVRSGREAAEQLQKCRERKVPG